MPVGLNSDASAAGVATEVDARLHAEIDDFYLPDDARLDDRTRLAIGRLLADVVGAIEGDIRRHAARLLAGRGRDTAAEALAGTSGSAAARLAATGMLRDPELMEQVIALARTTLMTEALPAAAEAADRPSLLLRLTDLPDNIVAAAARALLVADSSPAGSAGILSADLHHRLVWWVAAAIRYRKSDVEIDSALADAAQRCLVAHDEGERPEALATRLAAAIDPMLSEVPALLIEALGDRRLTLFIAILARSLGLDVEVVRSLVLNPGGERLWPALRAVGMERADIARVALSLADADPRRDIEAFADRLDTFAARDPDAARETLLPLALPRDFRLAINTLERRR